MTTTNPDQLGPQDFDECFSGEPAVPDPGADLARGRRRRRHRTAGLTGAGAATLVAAAVLGFGLTSPVSRTAVPAAPPASPPGAATTPTPTPGSPTPSTSASPYSRPESADTAPELRYSKAKGYLDRDGRPLGQSFRDSPFAATTKSTYDVVRRDLDPRRQHLEPYEKGAFSGGGSHDGLEVGQKLGWKIKGQSGEGMLLVSVTRAAPGKQPVTRGDEPDGLCSGTFVDASCRAATVDGHPVFLDRLPGDAFVVDLVQADGELASAWVDPLFGNNTDVPLSDMGVTLDAVVDMLADPDLDVVG